jgi:multimeric flavodoxin WrbA
MVNVMKVLRIVGSPHKDGRTDKLVTKAIEGSEKAGGQTEIMHLIDYDIPQWSEGHKTPRELNEIVDKADAYVLGAPLYCLDVNGLTKD